MIRKTVKSGKFLKFAYWATFLSFVFPIIYITVRIILAKDVDPESFEHTRAEYVLMLIQCLLGVLVINLPTIIARKLRFEIPKVLSFIYVVFLYCAIFLGEVRNFYYAVPYWDDILHCMSSVMTGLFGFMTVAILNHNTKVRMKLSPFFVALFAFCFSVTVGTVWEIYEFTADELMGLNMQKFMLGDGTLLTGHEALADTMKDFVVDCCGAFLATVIGYFSIKHKKGWIHDYLAGETKEENV